MTDDDHSVLFTELYIAIGGNEIVNARFGMNRSPLKYIFRCDGIELDFREGGALFIYPRALSIIERGTDQEMVLEDIFQHSLRDSVIGNTEREKTGQ